MHSENLSPKKHLHLLPEEINEEILSRLPVKSLLRFRCVSKSWLSLVESNRFIKIHYQNSSKNTSLAHHRVVSNGYQGSFHCYSLQSLLKSNSNSKKGSSCINIAYPTDRRGTILVGCCNGLLCLSSTIPNTGYVFCLWNPATKVLVELPQILSGYPFKFGFGWDESSSAFKVFATTKDESYETAGHVYSSKTNSWKTVLLPRVESIYDYLFNYVGMSVCGRIHWATQLHDDEKYVIDAFNLETDEFERIELPPPLNANATDEGGDLAPDPWLGEIGGCLCALFHDNKRIDMWVMKEYGVKDSWFKSLTFPINADDLHVSTQTGFPPGVFGECGLNGAIFIICRDKLMVYSPKDGDFSKVADIYPYVRGLVYVESLVSPLRIITIGSEEQTHSVI